MFDIDKYLSDMEIKEMDISEDILTRTKKRCEDEQKKAQQERDAMKKFKKAALIAVPITAVLLIGVFLGAWLFSTHSTFDAVAYYTVDVNPSLCVHVNEDGSVKSVVGQNDDAKAIIDKLNCAGKNVTDAIGDILAAVKDAGYFDAGQRYVLIGCFTADGTQVQGQLSDLQSKLEADFGDMINLLIVSGNLDDLQEAYQLNVSAGLLKLAKLADGVDVSGGVEDVYKSVQCVSEGNYCAPEISASVTDKINLSWDEIDFDAMGYAGKIRYSIGMGDSEAEAESGDAAIIKTFSFYNYADQPRSFSVSIDPGATKYFALYAQYGETVKCSNAVMATMPGEPVVSPTPTPTGTEEPAPSETPLPAHTVSGRVSGDKVILSWSPATEEGFEGYKVVASRTNPNPSYPDDGYLKYITNRDTTSISLYEGYSGLLANTSYYFSITYLYSGGDNIAANAVRLKVPPKTEEPAGDYQASRISGGISGNNISLHWTTVSDAERFDYYKVALSYSVSKPVYPAQDYIYYSSCIDDNGCSFDVSDIIDKLGEYKAGAVCHFSVTVVYDDHTVFMPGSNAISISLPDPGTEEPDESYASTNIRASLIDGGTKIKLTWGEISDERFEYYKILVAYDSNPTYPGDMYDYTSDSTDTSYYINLSDLCCEPGDTIWFRITVIYRGDVRMPGAKDSITIPVVVPDPTEDPGEPSCDPSDGGGEGAV